MTDELERVWRYHDWSEPAVRKQLRLSRRKLRNIPAANRRAGRVNRLRWQIRLAEILLEGQLPPTLRAFEAANRQADSDMVDSLSGK